MEQGVDKLHEQWSNETKKVTSDNKYLLMSLFRITFFNRTTATLAFFEFFSSILTKTSLPLSFDPPNATQNPAMLVSSKLHSECTGFSAKQNISNRYFFDLITGTSSQSITFFSSPSSLGSFSFSFSSLFHLYTESIGASMAISLANTGCMAVGTEKSI